MQSYEVEIMPLVIYGIGGEYTEKFQEIPGYKL